MESLRRTWLALVALGCALVALGTVAVLAPLFEDSPAFLGVFVGCVFLLAGVGHLALAVRGRDTVAVLLFNLVDGLVYIVLATYFLLVPTAPLDRVRSVLVGFFVVHGLLFVAFGLRLRGVDYWQALVLGGSLSILLAVLGLLGVFPPRPTGIQLVGVSFLAVGLALLVVGRGVRPTGRGRVIDPWG